MNRTNWHDVAQICLNGHIVNTTTKERPEFNLDFCKDCGARTTTKCAHCGVEIQGAYWTQGYGSPVTTGLSQSDPPPKFCHSCGTPYSWTQATLDAARSLAMELESLSAEEREALAGSLDDLVRDTPRTNVAALRFKKLVGKVGREAAMAFKQLLADVVTEAVKKQVWPSG